MANIWLVFYHAAHWQNHLEKWMQSLKIWLEERESITVHDRLALWFKQEIDWPIDFAQNVNVQCCRQREALSYQDGWAGSTYFPWSYFLQDKYSSGETKRTVGIEQFQKAEFVSFELTEHIGRVLKCLFFFFLYLKIQSMLNVVFILIAYFMFFLNILISSSLFS